MKKSGLILILLGAGVAWPQGSADRITVPFSDPSRPHTLKIDLVNGGITVKGYDGKEAIIESHGLPAREEHPARPPRGAEGMKRLGYTLKDLTATEEDNVLTISVGPEDIREMLFGGGGATLAVQVPVNTSLKLSCIDGGDIVVDRISGDIEVNNTNGGVKLTNVSGSVIAHALNKDVVVKLSQITPDKSMAFTSLNGDIDVTLPADTKAQVKMKTDNGEIYTDFDIKLGASSSKPMIEDGRAQHGKYLVRVDHAMYGTINGGGPDFRFETFNGNIYIRKAK